MSYCDRHGNCLTSIFGYSIPLISYTMSFILFLTFSLDSIQPDTNLEILQVVTFDLTNLAIRVLVIVLSLAFLGNKTLNMKILNITLKLSKPFQLNSKAAY